MIGVYHYFICHSAGVYVDSKFTFLHTYNIEHTWSRLKSFGGMPLRMAKTKHLIEKFTDEFCLRGAIKNELLYDFALRRIRDYYMHMVNRHSA